MFFCLFKWSFQNNICSNLSLFLLLLSLLTTMVLSMLFTIYSFILFFQYSQILRKHILYSNDFLVVIILVWTQYNPWCQVFVLSLQDRKTNLCDSAMVYRGGKDRARHITCQSRPRGNWFSEAKCGTQRIRKNNRVKKVHGPQ